MTFRRRRPRGSFLQVTELESRVVPAVNIRFDYSFDRSGFFDDPVRRTALEDAADAIGPYLGDALSEIIPTGTNTWRATFVDPSSRETRSIENPWIAASELVIFVGAAPIGPGELGIATAGGYSASGSRTWLETVRARGQAGALQTPRTDYAPWGGSIAFDIDSNWYFGRGTPARSQYDFTGVAIHELMHIFGFGLGEQAFMRHVEAGEFVGPAVVAAAGGPVPVTGNPPDHWDDVLFGGRESPMQAALTPGVRRMPTPADYAVLADVGWQVSGVPGLAAAPVSRPVPVSVPSTPPAPPRLHWYAVGTDSKAVLYDAEGRARVSIAPFPGTTGGIRVASADITGDGTPDIVAGTGPGVVAEVRIIDGVNRRLVAAVNPFEATFGGGVFVAAGDVTGDGRPDLVVSPDRTGGPVVAVYDGAGLARAMPVQVARFFGIADTNFRGGARTAVGDVNGDGVADVVVAAGHGGGPRVAVFDGRTVRTGRPVSLTPDFFAFEPGLRNGTTVAVTDLDGDGRGEVVTGAGPGGAPRVTAFGGRELLAGRKRPVADFFVGSPTARDGIRIAVGDPNGDGHPDLLTGSGAGGRHIRLFDTGGLTRGHTTPWLIFTPTDIAGDGVYVG
jgi:hypothetical protein